MKYTEEKTTSSPEEQLKAIWTVLNALAETDQRLQERDAALQQRDAALRTRHEALMNRHEGLAQSVEFLTHDVHELKDKLDILTERTIQAMDAISRLAGIAANHDRRIEDLEDRS